MPAALYMDVHVPQAVTEQLLRRRVDVLTAIEDEADRRPDDELLAHASALGRIVVTFDIRFLAMAEQWQRSGREFRKSRKPSSVNGAQQCAISAASCSL
jgi:hypothetical protein